MTGQFSNRTEPANAETFSDNEETIVKNLAEKYSLPQDAVETVLSALRSGGGTMARFSHPFFGGMAQWSSGMTMIGHMFDNALKAKLNALCTDLAAYLRAQPIPTETISKQEQAVSYRSGKEAGAWWPQNLGAPSAVGAQNTLRYATFPETHRLVIEDSGRMTVYDTGDLQISGVSQQQSGDQTISFTSQRGLVHVADLPIVSST